MSLFSDFETNPKAEKEGVLFPCGTNNDGSQCKFRLARAGKANKKYQKVLQAAMKPHRHAIDNDALKEEIAEEVMLDVFIKSILIGWDNVQDEEGKTIKYSQEKAKELMQQLPDLYDTLDKASKKAATFRDAIMKEEAKN